MTNSEKIQILKDNIFNIIRNTMRVDETYLFNFAKQQAKEMRIEITKGEIKSIIYDVLMHFQENTDKAEKDFNSTYNHQLSQIHNEFENNNSFFS